MHCAQFGEIGQVVLDKIFKYRQYIFALLISYFILLALESRAIGGPPKKIALKKSFYVVG